MGDTRSPRPRRPRRALPDRADSKDREWPIRHPRATRASKLRETEGHRELTEQRVLVADHPQPPEPKTKQLQRPPSSHRRIQSSGEPSEGASLPNTTVVSAKKPCEAQQMNGDAREEWRRGERDRGGTGQHGTQLGAAQNPQRGSKHDWPAGPTRPIHPSPAHAPARSDSGCASNPNVIVRYSAVEKGESAERPQGTSSAGRDQTI